MSLNDNRPLCICGRRMGLPESVQAGKCDRCRGVVTAKAPQKGERDYEGPDDGDWALHLPFV